jgi:hypothetical protein
MLIFTLLRLIAAIFTTRPPGIAPGQWSPHARDAVRLLEQRHFRHASPHVPARRMPHRRVWTTVVPASAPGAEGEWTCTP